MRTEAAAPRSTVTTMHRAHCQNDYQESLKDISGRTSETTIPHVITAPSVLKRKNSITLAVILKQLSIEVSKVSKTTVDHFVGQRANMKHCSKM